MNLESPKVTIQKSSTELFEYLSKMENFEKLMPENIEKFEADGDTFTFTLKGMPEIKLQLQEQEAPKKIVLGSASSQFPFTLITSIDSLSESESDLQFHFNGKFNPMVAMMIKKPLQKFINTMADNL